MDDETLQRAVDLLLADEADTVQLSFFGGEPFLAFNSMQRAVALAETRTGARGRRLIIQCTTNGTALKDEHVEFIKEHDVRTTVSIDGVREAHDLNRPCAGGGSSFDQTRGGLRKLIAAGCKPDAMMVISPQTVPYVYSSVSFLWDEGVDTVRANMVLDAPWTAEDREELREQLLSVGWEMLARRTRGELASFEPFERGMRGGTRFARRAPTDKRAQVTVASTGFLYPCSPMVGEDRESGPESALRIGHLDDGRAKIVDRVGCDGVACSSGGACDCASYLETGNRKTPGPNGRWYAAVCAELGGAIAAALAANHYPPSDEQPSRRPFLFGMAAAIGGLAVGVPALLKAGLFSGDEPAPRTAGDMVREPPPVPQETLQPPGMLMPPDAPPVREVMVDGDMAMPDPEPREVVGGNMRVPDPVPAKVRGGIGSPDPEPVVKGDID